MGDRKAWARALKPLGVWQGIGPRWAISGSGLPANARFRRYQKPPPKAPARTTTSPPPGAGRRRQHHHGQAQSRGHRQPCPWSRRRVRPPARPRAEAQPTGREPPAPARGFQSLHLASGPRALTRIAIAGKQQGRGGEVVLGSPGLPHDQRMGIEDDRAAATVSGGRDHKAARYTRRRGRRSPASRS